MNTIFKALSGISMELCCASASSDIKAPLVFSAIAIACGLISWCFAAPYKPKYRFNRQVR